MSRVKIKAKLYSGSRRPPRAWQRYAAIGAVVVFCLGGSVLLWRNGWPQRQAQAAGNALLAATGRLGFSLQSVTIEGRERTKKAELLQALQTERGKPTLGLDQKQMAARLQQLPWLASATLERRLPDALHVRVTERQPLALWQHQNHVQVIDRDGTPISGANTKEFAGLPLVVGAGAPERAYELLAILADFPTVQKVTRAAICVGARRWDLQLEPGVIVRLPEGREAEGLQKLTTLINDPQILSRAVQAVDLRLPDRMTIERPPGTAAATKTAKGGLKR